MGFNRVWGGPDSIAASHKWEEKKYFEKERKKEKKRNELIRPGLTTARTVMFHRFLFSVWRLFFFVFFYQLFLGREVLKSLLTRISTFDASICKQFSFFFLLPRYVYLFFFRVISFCSSIPWFVCGRFTDGSKARSDVRCQRFGPTLFFGTPFPET